MTFTDEQIMKEVKKNRKLIKQVGDTNNWWLFIFALILLFALFIPHASAITYYWIDLGNQITYPNDTSAQALLYPYSGLGVDADKNFCLGKGYNSYAGGGLNKMEYYDTGYLNVSSSTMNNGDYNNYFLHYAGASTKSIPVAANSYFNFTANQYKFVEAYQECWDSAVPSNHYMYRLSSAARADVYNHTYDPLSASFTAIPQSGNQSLTVTFTPTVYGPNLNRVVWDFDGGLGTETKIIGMNNSFTKIYTSPGHFIARLTAYNNAGQMVTASKNIDVYNYTAGVTPTPTLTPTPTPTGQTNNTAYITVSSYDALNNTPLVSPTYSFIDTNDVGSGWFNVTANSGSYVFNGYSSGGSKSFVVGHTYMVVITKTGYDTTTHVELAPYTGAQEDWSIPVQPSTYIPTSSAFTLYVPMYDSQTTDLIGYKTGTVTISNQSSSWTASATVTHDAVTFAGMKPGDSYKLDFAITGYQAFTGYFASSSGMGGTYQTYIATLTPTNLQPSVYTLTVAPSSGTVNDTYSLSVTPTISSASISKVSFKYSSSTSAALSMKSGSGYTDYVYTGGSWKQWDGSTYSITASPVNTVSATFNNLQDPSSTNVVVTVYLTSNLGQVYQSSATINLVSQGKTPKSVVAYDMSGNGGATSANKYDFTAHILDVYANTWTNTTYTIDTYPGYYYVTPNALYQYYGSATGYYDTATQSKVFTGNVGEGGFEFRLYKITAAPTLANATLYAHARDSSQKNMEGVRITFSDGQKCFTNNAGSCGVYALVGGQYTAVGTAYGYATGTGSITVSNTSSNIIEILMLPASANRNNTVTVNPTSIIRTIPTYSNISGFNNTPAFEEYSCSLNPDGGVFDIFMNFIACAGVKGADKQGLTFAALVMFIFAMGLSNKGKSSGGALAGVIIGAVVSMAMGLIPFWILIVMITICGLIFAKLMSGSGPSGGQ